MRLAAVDVGSNTVHALVADVVGDGLLKGPCGSIRRDGGRVNLRDRGHQRCVEIVACFRLQEQEHDLSELADCRVALP